MAMKNAIELIEVFRMVGVLINGATNIFCDNEAVTMNCSDPSGDVAHSLK